MPAPYRFGVISERCINENLFINCVSYYLKRQLLELQTNNFPERISTMQAARVNENSALVFILFYVQFALIPCFSQFLFTVSSCCFVLKLKFAFSELIHNNNNNKQIRKKRWTFISNYCKFIEIRKKWIKKVACDQARQKKKRKSENSFGISVQLEFSFKISNFNFCDNYRLRIKLSDSFSNYSNTSELIFAAIGNDFILFI